MYNVIKTCPDKMAVLIWLEGMPAHSNQNHLFLRYNSQRRDKNKFDKVASPKIVSIQLIPEGWLCLSGNPSANTQTYNPSANSQTGL